MNWITYEIRLAFRILLQERAFTCACVLTLALGIGSLTAVFAILHSTLIRRLPYQGDNQLLAITSRGAPYSVSFQEYSALAQRSRAIEALGLYVVKETELGLGESRELVNRASITATCFQFLESTPVRGRSFAVTDDRPGGANLAVISSTLWRTRFGGRDDILEREISLSAV